MSEASVSTMESLQLPGTGAGKLPKGTLSTLTTWSVSRESVEQPALNTCNTQDSTASGSERISAHSSPTFSATSEVRTSESSSVARPRSPLPRCAVVAFRKDGDTLRWTPRVTENAGGVAAHAHDFDHAFKLEESSARALGRAARSSAESLSSPRRSRGRVRETLRRHARRGRFARWYRRRLNARKRGKSPRDSHVDANYESEENERPAIVFSAEEDVLAGEYFFETMSDPGDEDLLPTSRLSSLWLGSSKTKRRSLSSSLFRVHWLTSQTASVPPSYPRRRSHEGLMRTPSVQPTASSNARGDTRAAAHKSRTRSKPKSIRRKINRFLNSTSSEDPGDTSAGKRPVRLQPRAKEAFAAMQKVAHSVPEKKSMAEGTNLASKDIGAKKRFSMSLDIDDGSDDCSDVRKTVSLFGRRRSSVLEQERRSLGQCGDQYVDFMST